MLDYFETLTCNALALLINGMMWRALCIDRAAQPLWLLIGRRLDKLDGWLKDTELQRHRHLWGKKYMFFFHVRGQTMFFFCLWKYTPLRSHLAQTYFVAESLEWELVTFTDFLALLSWQSVNHISVMCILVWKVQQFLFWLNTDSCSSIFSLFLPLTQILLDIMCFHLLNLNPSYYYWVTFLSIKPVYSEKAVLKSNLVLQTTLMIISYKQTPSMNKPHSLS